MLSLYDIFAKYLNDTNKLHGSSVMTPEEQANGASGNSPP